MFLASSVNRFLEDILSSSNQNHDDLKVWIQLWGVQHCSCGGVWSNLKFAARINHKIWMKCIYLMNQRWTWKLICSSMNSCLHRCRFMPWPSSEVSVKCAAAYPDRATTSIHATRCTHARMVVHGFLGPWCQLTSVSATIKIQFSQRMNMGDFQGMLKVWIELTWRHPIYNFDPFWWDSRWRKGNIRHHAIHTLAFKPSTPRCHGFPCFGASSSGTSRGDLHELWQ